MRLSVGCHGEEHRQNGNGGPVGLHELEPPALEARPGTSPGRVSSDVNGKVLQPPSPAAARFQPGTNLTF